MQLIGFSNYLNGLKANLCKFRQHKSVVRKKSFLIVIIFSVVTTLTQTLSFIYYNYKSVKKTMLRTNYILF